MNELPFTTDPLDPCYLMWLRKLREKFSDEFLPESLIRTVFISAYGHVKHARSLCGDFWHNVTKVDISDQKNPFYNVIFAQTGKPLHQMPEGTQLLQAELSNMAFSKPLAYAFNHFINEMIQHLQSK